MSVTLLDHIILTVSDIERSLKFYKASPRSDRDNVMVRFLDRADEFEHSIQDRSDVDTHADCISIRGRYSVAAVALQ
jgi:hypothetical protein